MRQRDEAEKVDDCRNKNEASRKQHPCYPRGVPFASTASLSSAGSSAMSSSAACNAFSAMVGEGVRRNARAIRHDPDALEEKEEEKQVLLL